MTKWYIYTWHVTFTYTKALHIAWGCVHTALVQVMPEVYIILITGYTPQYINRMLIGIIGFRSLCCIVICGIKVLTGKV